MNLSGFHLLFLIGETLSKAFELLEMLRWRQFVGSVWCRYTFTDYGLCLRENEKVLALAVGGLEVLAS